MIIALNTNTVAFAMPQGVYIFAIIILLGTA
jgi:hypothetical protein